MISRIEIPRKKEPDGKDPETLTFTFIWFEKKCRESCGIRQIPKDHLQV